jgi:hypothetical protein
MWPMPDPKQNPVINPDWEEEDEEKEHPVLPPPRELSPERQELVKQQYGESWQNQQPPVEYKQKNVIYVGLDPQIHQQLIGLFQQQTGMYMAARDVSQSLVGLLEGAESKMPFAVGPRMQQSPEDIAIFDLMNGRLAMSEELQQQTQQLRNAMHLYGISVEEIRNAFARGESVRFAFFEENLAAIEAAGKQVKIIREWEVQAPDPQKAAKERGIIQESDEAMKLANELRKDAPDFMEKFGRLKDIINKAMPAVKAEASKRLLKASRSRVKVHLAHAIGPLPETTAAVAVAEPETAVETQQEAKIAMSPEFWREVEIYLSLIGECLAEVDPMLTIVWTKYSVVLREIEGRTKPVTAALERFASVDLTGGGVE